MTDAAIRARLEAAGQVERGHLEFDGQCTRCEIGFNDKSGHYEYEPWPCAAVRTAVRVRELEEMVSSMQTLHRGTVHPGNCYDHNLAVHAALAPGPRAGGE